MKKVFSACMILILTVALSLTAAAAAPKLNKTKLSIRYGEKVRISANQKVEWFSSDESVATVNENGKIKAIDYGTVRITAVNKKGETAVCKVKVHKDNYTVQDTEKAAYPKLVTVYYGKNNNKTRTYKVYNKLASKMGAIRARGCSHSAIATVLSAYGSDVTPEMIHGGSVKKKYSERYAWYKTERRSSEGQKPLAIRAVSEILKNNGIANKVVYKFSDKKAIKDIKANLKKGRPVIALINGKGTGKVSFSNWFHYVTLAGLDEAGNVIVLDSIGGLVNETKKTGEFTMPVETFVKKLMKSCRGNRYKGFYHKDGRSYGGYVLVKER